MKTPYVGPSALEINLQRTAMEVRIPEEHKVLLEATKESVGVHEKTEQLLKEVNHPYVNWSHVLQDLRTYATGNFYYHNTYEKGDQAIGVLIHIFLSVADGAPSVHVRTEAVRSLLRYLEKVVAGADSHAVRNRPAVEDAFRGILERFEGDPEMASLLSGGVRRVMRLAANNNPGWDEDLLSRVTRKALRETYQRWLSLPDPANWVEQADPDEIPSLDRIRHGRVREYLNRLDAFGDDNWERLVGDTETLPDQTGMEGLWVQS